jgi:hypothetical protein
VNTPAVEEARTEVDWRIDAAVSEAWDAIDPTGYRSSYFSDVRKAVPHAIATGYERLDEELGDRAFDVVFRPKDGTFGVGDAVVIGFVLWDVAAVVRGATPLALLEVPFVVSDMQAATLVEDVEIFLPVAVQEELPGFVARVRAETRSALEAQRAEIEAALPDGVRWAEFVRQSEDEAAGMFLLRFLEDAQP